MLTAIAGAIPPDLATAVRRFGGGPSPAAAGGILDDDGFTHFKSTPPASQNDEETGPALHFIADLVAAVQKDLAAMAMPRP